MLNCNSFYSFPRNSKKATQTQHHFSTSLKFDWFSLDFDCINRASRFVIVSSPKQPELVDTAAHHFTLATELRAMPNRSLASPACYVVRVPLEAQISVAPLVFDEIQPNSVPDSGRWFLLVQQHGSINCGDKIDIILVLHHLHFNSLKPSS